MADESTITAYLFSVLALTLVLSEGTSRTFCFYLCLISTHSTLRCLLLCLYISVSLSMSLCLYLSLCLLCLTLIYTFSLSPTLSLSVTLQCASCYGSRSVQPLQLFGKSPNSSYISLLTYRNPRGGPRPRLACHGPKLTLRQICRMLRMMRQVRNREAAATAAAARSVCSSHTHTIITKTLQHLKNQTKPEMTIFVSWSSLIYKHAVFHMLQFWLTKQYSHMTSSRYAIHS